MVNFTSITKKLSGYEIEVNRILMKVHILLDPASVKTKGTYTTALGLADMALGHAFASGRYDLVAKVELFRGHCFRGLNQPYDAYRSYVRSASVCEFASEVERLTAEVLAEIKELEEGQKAATKNGARRASYCFTEFEKLGHHIRDGHGELCDILERKPDLRSCKGKSVANLRIGL